MTRDELNSMLTELGIEPTKAMVTALLSRFNEEKRNAIAETTEKLLDDTKDWVSPDDFQKMKSDYETLKQEYDDFKAKGIDLKDYEELKRFKAESLEKIENDKKVDFLKANGCKHPDLIMGKLDFSKGVYDEEKKTYTGLDDDVKGLREAYGDLFEAQGTQKITPAQQGQSSNTFLDQYLAENPGMAKFINQN